MRKRPLLRYFGGKWRIANWIISNFPEHRIYVEPFGGAGSVLFKKEPCYAEVWNDMDDSVYNLFWVLKHEDMALELKSQLERTPFSRREFELAHVFTPNQVENARRLIIRSFMGFGADSVTNLNSKTGFRSDSGRSGSTPAKDWVNYSHKLEVFSERLKGVVIESKDATDVMKDHDGPDTLHYVDPPYPHTTRRGGRYKHEMTNDDHIELVSFLKTLKGKVCVSGYDCEIYNSLNWRKETKEARADKSGKRIEVLWMNYEDQK